MTLLQERETVQHLTAINLLNRTTSSWLESGGYGKEIRGIAVAFADQNSPPNLVAAIQVEKEKANFERVTRVEILPTSYVRMKCPQVLIRFYETKFCRDLKN